MNESLNCAIGTVARLTGLTEHTIRAWERRYAVVKPLRSKGGTRRYRQSDLRKLDLLAKAVGRGHKIKSLATLSEAQLSDLVEPDLPRRPATLVRAATSIANPSAGVVDSLFDVSKSLKAAELNRIMTAQFQLLGGARFAREVAVPLLYKIGTAWMNGELSITAEHLVSAQLRRLLGNALMMMGENTSRPIMIFTTPENEPHEFGALVAAIVAANAGAQVTYLGADTPADVVAEAVELLQADVVAISIVNLAEGAQRRYFQSLRRCVPGTTEIWVGGNASINGPGMKRLSGLDELKDRIGKIAAGTG